MFIAISDYKSITRYLGKGLFNITHKYFYLDSNCIDKHHGHVRHASTHIKVKEYVLILIIYPNLFPCIAHLSSRIINHFHFQSPH